MRTLEELKTKANELYDKLQYGTVEQWKAEFTPLELAKLWHETCQFTKANPFGAGYDDEVYEALNSLGYFE